MRFGLGFSPTPSILTPKASSEKVESGVVAGRNCDGGLRAQKFES